MTYQNVLCFLYHCFSSFVFQQSPSWKFYDSLVVITLLKILVLLNCHMDLWFLIRMFEINHGKLSHPTWPTLEDVWNVFLVLVQSGWVWLSQSSVESNLLSVVFSIFLDFCLVSTLDIKIFINIRITIFICQCYISKQSCR